MTLRTDVLRDILEATELMLDGQDLAAYDRIFDRTLATPEPGEVVTATLAHLVDLLAAALQAGGEKFVAAQLAEWHAIVDIDEVFE